MIVLLSPAKNLKCNFSKSYDMSQPVFLEEASQIAQILKKMSVNDFEKLMKLSPNLARTNYERYQDWSTDLGEQIPAVFLYSGQVYEALKASSISESGLYFAQKHLRIISGLYGLLKPLDSIAPYRLEMKAKIQIQSYKNLYDFWQQKLTEKLNQELALQTRRFIINLSSSEYTKVIDKTKVQGKIITITFKNFKNGQYKSIMSYFKTARGLMAKYIIENKIDELEDIKKFNQNGYVYNAELSQSKQWVFTAKS